MIYQELPSDYWDGHDIFITLPGKNAPPPFWILYRMCPKHDKLGVGGGKLNGPIPPSYADTAQCAHTDTIQYLHILKL